MFTRFTPPIRAGVLLILVGVFGLGLAVRYASGWWLLIYGFAGLALVAGGLLLRGSLTAARCVRSVMGFLLGVTAAGVVGVGIVWPPGLLLTEARLDPMLFLWPAIAVAVAVCIEWWIVRQLSFASARITPANAAKAGAAATLVGVALLWAMLHGGSAEAATALAEQQLGAGYSYALTWISRTSHDGRKGVDGVVTAWNDHDIKTVLLHWDVH